MPLSPPKSPRVPLHHRQVSVRGYKRDDGYFDIEGSLTDVKDLDISLMGGYRAAGEPIHLMWLRLTIDSQLIIIDAEAVTDEMPYEGFCNTITPRYDQLIGLSIRPGFTQKIRELYAGRAGCTHITDLIGILATTAFQTLAGQVAQSADRKPYQLDRCHALATDSPAVARFYPNWYRGGRVAANALAAEANEA